jgi:4-diphosphocytidyl-2-C-methyl-D-erythritol kinase
MLLYSYAKLNLFLRITHQQKNGYHFLQSLFMRVNLCDYIKIYPQKRYYISAQYVNTQEEFDKISPDSDSIKYKKNHFLNRRIPDQLVNTHPHIPVAHDLNIKAARLLQNYIKTEYPNTPISGAHICVYKNIPMGAGLGGGSSNAAHVLLALNELWQLNLNIQTLCALGLTLGADVPFFIHQIHAAWVEGIGENIQPIRMQECYFIIIKPDVHISTKRIFMHADLQRNNTRVNVPYNYINIHNITESANYSVISELYNHGNTLQSLVFNMHPHIAHWFNQKHIENIQFQMTGSGSCFFAIFENMTQRDAILEKIKTYLPNNWLVYAAKSQA